MNPLLDTLPNIKKAVLSIAYDNGCINREQTEQQALDRAEEVIGAEGLYLQDLREIDIWLGNLSEEDLETVCSGEQMDQEHLLRNSPEGTDGLLNDIFENL